MKKGAKMSYERKKAWYGRSFLLPWMLGALIFLIVPLVKSLVYTFQKVTLGSGGFQSPSFVGLDNYVNILAKNPEYIRVLTAAVTDVLYQVPIILLFSLFVAVMLNQKFKGRFLARAVMFLPVIVTSGIIMTILKNDVFAQSVVSQGGSNASFVFKTTGLTDMLAQSGLSPSLLRYFTTVINRIFDTMWKSGVQILLFLSALQAVPVSVYEAVQVEGATAWETFWKVTFPMVSPMILVNLVYSIVDSFSDFGSPLMQMIYTTAFNEHKYSQSAAMAWIFFICVGAIISVAGWLISRRIHYMEG